MGFSGTRWRVDFMVSNRLVFEASIQRNQRTKINEVFLKFTDICKANPNLKAALVVADYHIQSQGGDMVFPSASFATAIKHGFPIMLLDDIAGVTGFINGELSAEQVSTIPSFAHNKGRYVLGQLHRPRQEAAILQLLHDGTPRRMKDIHRILRRDFESKAQCAYMLLMMVKDGRIQRVGWRYGVDGSADDGNLNYLRLMV